MPELILAASVLQFLWLAGLTLMTYVRRPGEEAQRELVDLQQRLQSVEVQMRHMPSSTELARVSGAVDTLAAVQRQMQESVDQLRGVTTRLEQYLLEHGPRAHSGGA